MTDWSVTAVSGLRWLSCLLLSTLLWADVLSAQETGSHARGCELSPLNGPAPETWSAFEGKLVYVDFWASWCLPCLRSFPFMMELAAETGYSELQIVAVNLDEDLDAARDFLADHQLQDPARGILAVVDETKACARAFGVTAMPSSYLIDRTGVIRYQHRGFRPADEQIVRAQILKLLEE